jgi:hypothetical protein
MPGEHHVTAGRRPAPPGCRRRPHVFISTAPIGIAATPPVASANPENNAACPISADELRRLALRALPRRDPGEHFHAIGLAAQKERAGLRRPSVRSERGDDRHRQRPDQHPRHREAKIPALEREDHERKTGKRIENRQQDGTADRPPEGVGEKRRGTNRPVTDSRGLPSVVHFRPAGTADLKAVSSSAKMFLVAGFELIPGVGGSGRPCARA